MDSVKRFDVSRFVNNPMKTECTSTYDIIVAGQKNMAIFNCDGEGKRTRDLQMDPDSRGVAMNSQGNIIITENIRSSIKCTKCESSVCKLMIARFLQYDLNNMGTELAITTKCSTGKHSLSKFCMPKSHIDRVSISAVEPTKDFHTVLCDIGNNCLYVFKHDKIIQVIGKSQKPPIFKGPHAIASLSTGNIVVGDYLDKQIKIFTIKGKVINAFGEKVPGGIFPQGVAVDSKDRIIVADRDNHRVLMFDKTGLLLHTLISDTKHDDIDIRPVSVSVKKLENGDRLYVLLKGIPGTNFAQVHIYSIKGRQHQLERPDHTGDISLQPVGHNDVDAPTAPPPYDLLRKEMERAHEEFVGK